MTRTGRPKLPQGKVKTKVYAIRLQEEERSKIEEIAAKEGLKSSTWIRKVLQKAINEAINRIT